MNEPMNTNESHEHDRHERDRRTMEAVARLYRKNDAEPSPALFDDVPAETHQPDRMAAYVELMGRGPLHAEEDKVVLAQKPQRRR